MQNEHVFIIGCARTGSTLLRHLLIKSERICITPETHFLRRVSRVGLRKEILRFGDLSHDGNASKLVDFMYSDSKTSAGGYWRWLSKHVDKVVFKERLLESDRSERAIFALMMQVYAEKKKGVISTDLILGEKTPTHLYYVPTLLEWFPQAKIIHTFRDPRAIFVSTLKFMKTGEWGLKAKLPSVPPWLLDPVIHPIEVLRITKVWFDAVRLHATYEQLYPQQYHFVRFEDLISDPAGQLQHICGFLNVPFESQMLEEVAVVGSSFYAQPRVVTGLDRKATERWREHIHPLVKAWFSILGSKHLKKFGYLP